MNTVTVGAALSDHFRTGNYWMITIRKLT
jgi:hypothetical protein